MANGEKKPIKGFLKFIYILAGTMLTLIGIGMVALLVWIGFTFWDSCNCAALFAAEDCAGYFAGIDLSRLFGCTG